MPSAPVPEEAKQAHETRDPRQWPWVEPTVWTERMLAALVNGVVGGKWYSLWDKVCDRRTLEASWRAVARNHGAAGVDGQSVQRFAAQAERYLEELAADLKAGRYHPDDVRRTYIAKAGGVVSVRWAFPRSKTASSKGRSNGCWSRSSSGNFWTSATASVRDAGPRTPCGSSISTSRPSIPGWWTLT